MNIRTIIHILPLLTALTFSFTIENCDPYKAEIQYAVTLAQVVMMKPLHDVQFGVTSRYAKFISNLERLNTDHTHPQAWFQSNGGYSSVHFHSL